MAFYQDKGQIMIQKKVHVLLQLYQEVADLKRESNQSEMADLFNQKKNLFQRVLKLWVKLLTHHLFTEVRLPMTRLAR